MKPEIWGPPAWIFLHSITLEYPENPTNEDKVNMLNFINSLGNVLPCMKCKINFNTHLQKYPVDQHVLESRSKLVKWLIDIHNAVNIMNNKKELSYENCLKELLEMYNCKNDKNLLIIYILIIIIIVGICGFLFKMFL